MSYSLPIPLDALENGPYHLHGTLPGSLLDVEHEASIRNVGEVSYDLTAEKVGEEVLLRGRVAAPMELECVRSGLFFSTIVQDSAFLRAYSISDLPGGLQGGLDVAEDVREAVVIEIPLYPVSPEARSEEFELPRPPSEWTGGDDSGAGESPWKDLENFKPDHEPPA